MNGLCAFITRQDTLTKSSTNCAQHETAKAEGCVSRRHQGAHPTSAQPKGTIISRHQKMACPSSIGAAPHIAAR